LGVPELGKLFLNLPKSETSDFGWREKVMNEDKLNVSLRKFLKTVGVTSQREIEKAIRDALQSGKIKGNEKLPAKVVLTVGGVGLNHEVKGDLELE
jgi:Family of unknown function (DUF6494)